MQNGVFVKNYDFQGYDFCMTVTPNETANRKTLFWFPNFPALETKKVALVGKKLRHFDINLHI